MTDRDALVAAVFAAPGDDLPRLVLADWLEEQGYDQDAARLRRAGMLVVVTADASRPRGTGQVVWTDWGGAPDEPFTLIGEAPGLPDCGHCGEKETFFDRMKYAHGEWTCQLCHNTIAAKRLKAARNRWRALKANRFRRRAKAT
jgi:uncharacterized protein (TIGR02996 family)